MARSSQLQPYVRKLCVASQLRLIICRSVKCLPLVPELLPPLLALVTHPASSEMHDQIAWLPLHPLVAFSICIGNSLPDKSYTLSERLMMLDKMQLSIVSASSFSRPLLFVPTTNWERFQLTKVSCSCPGQSIPIKNGSAHISNIP